MNEYGKKLFYVQRPLLQNLDEFRNNCSTSEQTIVLGCYKTNVGIYIYGIEDSRLQGVKQVTAAHEMLHAAYDRLSQSEKNKVNQLTLSAFNQLTDERVKKNIESYRTRDASVVPNELHSILATEVDSLPPELEQYYKKYFIDRHKIVAFSNQYEGEFTRRESAIDAYDKQLEDTKSSIFNKFTKQIIRAAR